MVCLFVAGMNKSRRYSRNSNSRRHALVMKEYVLAQRNIRCCRLLLENRERQGSGVTARVEGLPEPLRAFTISAFASCSCPEPLPWWMKQEFGRRCLVLPEPLQQWRQGPF